jgi:hypothetical protein
MRGTGNAADREFPPQVAEARDHETGTGEREVLSGVKL